MAQETCEDIWRLKEPGEVVGKGESWWEIERQGTMLGDMGMGPWPAQARAAFALLA